VTPPLLLAAAALSLVVLAVVALATARRPVALVVDRDGYLDRWQVLHGGYDPRTGSTALRRWLAVVHAMARPVARLGIHPDVVTVAAAWPAAAVVVLADLGGRWWLVAAAGVVVSGVLDNLDGCVAVLQGRTTRWGYVLDSAVDRLTDCAYLLALVLVGCPSWLGATCAFAVFLLEYLRARAGNAGGDDVGRITIAERPTRVIVAAAALLLCGLLPDRSELASTAGVAVLLALTLVALGQLGAAVRRQLLSLPD
jgi:CDP-diacylglycerol--glycerol-3-phosphate 3-phosphatidyltransferase